MMANAMTLSRTGDVRSRLQLFCTEMVCL